MPEHVYNLMPSLPDLRDWPAHKLLGAPLITLPASDTHCRAFAPPIRDQGQLGSCTGFGGYRVMRYTRKVAGLEDFDLSPLFLYYNERKDQGTINQDSGATLKGQMQALANYGICHENLWSYILANWQSLPPQAAYSDALKDKAIEYASVGNDLNTIKQAIVNGFIVSLGFSVYDSFESAVASQTGDIPMPDVNREHLLGGHNTVLDTYDDATQRFGFANSWGVGWGNKGFGTLPYEYVTKLAFEGWIVRKVSGSDSPTPTPTPQSLTLAFVDDQIDHSISLNWNDVSNTYTLKFGLSPTVLSQSIPVGSALSWKGTYPADGRPRFGQVVAANGSVSNTVQFGGQAPSPPTPTPTNYIEVNSPTGGSFIPKIWVLTTSVSNTDIS